MAPRISSVISLALLVGCAAPQPQDDPNLIENVARKTPEQIRLENQQDIEAAAKALEWQAHVCAQPEPQRTQLKEETKEKYGWQLACKD